MKKAIKRIVALGTGATMLGATVLGAVAAADLADYPQPFVEGGVYNAIAVIGANAKAEDTIGVSDVLLGLGYVEGQATSGTTATTTLQGDAKKIVKGTDELNLYEYLSASSIGTGIEDGPISTVTDSDLNALADGSIDNDKGTFTYNQFIDLPEAAKVDYVTDDDQSDDPALYLHFEDDSLGYRYFLTFGTSLESDIDSDGTLEDLENEKIQMLGKEFTIVDSDNSTSIELMAGAVQDTLEEGESKTYTVNGLDYDVEVIIITDTGTSQVKFKINGEVTDAMVETETYRLSDGTEIGVKEILANEAGDVTQDLVEFYLGAQKITLTDSGLDGGGSLQVGSETISDIDVRLQGSEDGDEWRLSMIEINWTVGDDYYVPIGGKLSDQIDDDDKDVLFLRNLDFEFTDMNAEDIEEIEIDPYKANRVKISVPTKTGGDLSFDAFYSSGTTIALGKDATEILEDTESDAMVEDTMFVLSSDMYSHLLQVDDFNINDETVTFKDLGTGSTMTVTADTTGTLHLDGIAYSFTASYSPDNVTFDSFGTDHTDGEVTIYTAEEAKVVISVNGSGNYGLVEFEEYHGGKGDDSTSVDHINATITDAGTSDDIAVNEPTLTSGEFESWDSKDDYSDAYTRWGTHVEYDSDNDIVTIEYPSEESTVDVYITSGVVTTSSGGETTDGLVKVDVGAPMLDEEVADWKAQNVIVVGGPCVNTVAAELMGNPEDCAAGFEEGKAKIKLFHDIAGQEDNVALLIAGMTGDDTRRACSVMNSYSDYELEGVEVEMTATSDEDISLAAPEVEEDEE
jgi:hypothetical protein